MKKVILGLAICIFSLNINAGENRDEVLKEVIDRLLMLEKQVELLDQMVEQNTELVKTNRKLNEQNAKLMKLLHPKDLEKMNP